MPRLRSSEKFIIAYFVYVAIVASIRLDTSGRAWLLLAIVTAALGAISRSNSVWRDWLPLAAVLTAYRQMDWFAPGVYDHHLEDSWIVWDRWLLDSAGLRAAIEGIGPVGPFYFELCYLLVYAVGPATIAVELLAGGRKNVDRLWLAYLAGTLCTYALFPYFPSEPPRTAFPNADLPHVTTVLRRLNLFIVGGYGIHSSVFPSAHVSSALSGAWGLIATLRERHWIGWAMAFYGFSVAIAAIYGRYHYAVDALAGIAMSSLAIIALKLHPQADAQS